MKRINVNKDQLKSLRFGTTLNRDGRNSVNGYVFRDGNNVIKINKKAKSALLPDRRLFSYIDESKLEKYKKFSKEQEELVLSLNDCRNYLTNCLIPNALIYCDDILIGTQSEFIDGITLNLFKGYNIKICQEYLLKTLDVLKTLEKNHILFYDPNLGNIMVSNHNITLIDLDDPRQVELNVKAKIDYQIMYYSFAKMAIDRLLGLGTTFLITNYNATYEECERAIKSK